MRSRQSRDNVSKTFATRKSVLRSSVSCPSASRCLIGIGAQIDRPRSPLRTQRPSLSHDRKPATWVGVIPRAHAWEAISSVLLAL
jgi:hypothetical protein